MFLLKRFTWSQQLFAPYGFEAELIPAQSYWVRDNDTTMSFFSNAGGGWRNRPSNISGGPDKKVSIPVAVHLVWRSTTEKKMYGVKIDLPVKRIGELMSQSNAVTNRTGIEYDPYYLISFALAPGGWACVRLGGASSSSLEVACKQADVLDVSYERYMQMRVGMHVDPARYTGKEEEHFQLHLKGLASDVQERIKRGDIPTKRWRLYSETKYPWRLDVQGIRKMKEYSITYVNADSYLVPEKDVAMRAEEIKPVPVSIVVYAYKEGKRYQHIINFSRAKYFSGRDKVDDDLEIFELFAEHFKKSIKPARLLVNYQEDGYFRVFLTDGLITTPIPVFETQSYEIPDRHYWR